LTYHDWEGETYDDWDAEGDEAEETLPKMVSISMEFQNKLDSERPYKFVTAVTLPMSRGEAEE
jgi:hypothetical protein